MNLIRFAIRNISGSAFRSWVIYLCAALMAGFVVSATIVIGGAQKSLELALDRLGADIIVVPSGSEASMENAFLMGSPASMWMPRQVMEQISGLDGVSAVTPQLYLSTLRGASCCSVPEMFLIAYDPASDFTLKPWLEQNAPQGLQLGQAIGGNLVYIPLGQERILIYGYEIELSGNLESTGTGIDQSMFFTFETAREISRLSPFQAVAPLEIPADSISSVLVKVDLNSDPQTVAAEIKRIIPNVAAVESSNLFRTHRVQITGLLRSILVLMLITWVLSMSLVGLVFSMAVNERRREIGVLRAMGATRDTVLKSLLIEGVIVATLGGASGIALFILAIYLFRNLIIQLMSVPFFFPAPLSLVALSLGALGLALLSVVAAALAPALRISIMDPAIAMRE